MTLNIKAEVINIKERSLSSRLTLWKCMWIIYTMIDYIARNLFAYVDFFLTYSIGHTILDIVLML